MAQTSSQEMKHRSDAFLSAFPRLDRYGNRQEISSEEFDGHIADISEEHWNEFVAFEDVIEARTAAFESTLGREATEEEVSSLRAAYALELDAQEDAMQPRSTENGFRISRQVVFAVGLTAFAVVGCAAIDTDPTEIPYLQPTLTSTDTVLNPDFVSTVTAQAGTIQALLQPPTETLEPTNTSTPTPTPSATIEASLTPSATIAATSLAEDGASSFHNNYRYDFISMSGGVSVLNVPKFREYFAQVLENHGSVDGFRADILAELLATSPKGKDLTLAGGQLNFWRNSLGLLESYGWSAEDASKIADSYNAFLNTSDLENLSSVKPETNARLYAIAGTFEQMGDILYSGVLYRELAGAGLLGAEWAQIELHLSKPEVIERMSNLVHTLASTRGVQYQLANGNWPTPIEFLTQRTEVTPIFQPEMTYCVAYLDGVETRAQQNEVSVFAQSIPGLEQTPVNGTPDANNVTLTRNDSSEPIIVFFNFDQDAQATAGESLAVNGVGTLSVQIVRFSNRTDTVNGQDISTAVPDMFTGPARVDENRLIPCGTGRGEAPTPAPLVPSVESAPTGGNPPGGETPGGVTTPQPPNETRVPTGEPPVKTVEPTPPFPPTNVPPNTPEHEPTAPMMPSPESTASNGNKVPGSDDNPEPTSGF